MMQTGGVFVNSTFLCTDFPSPDSEVMPGVRWGLIEAFPSPAYWAYQVWASNQCSKSISYKLGTTLEEEVAACLLGGHGIPASVGLAAFAHLRSKNAFTDAVPDEESVYQWLCEPLLIDGRLVKYRFARQKARYLAAALQLLASTQPPFQSGKALRDWLMVIPGIGYKTASWIARNWLDADDVAILDIHILRAGLLGGFFSKELTVDRHYLRLEEEFLALSNGLNVKPSQLDALMWQQMMSAPSLVHGLLNQKLQQAA